MQFKKHLLEKVLDGSKTQTRRIHKRPLRPGRTYGVTCRRYQKPAGHITILHTRQQRLGDITEPEARAEGFNSIEEFKQAWIAIHGNWNPDQTVTAYEFQLENTQKSQKKQAIEE